MHAQRLGEKGMRTIVLGWAFALALGSAAFAGEPSDWVKCDGMAKPERAGVTAARIGAVVFSMGLLGLPEESRAAPAARGQAGVDACTSALAQPELEPFWARRVSLIRARALHHVEVGKLDNALADLEATRAAAAGHVEEAYYARSMGIAVTLLKGAILASRGQTAEAEALAISAADARPYSLQVQSLAAAILAIDPAWSANEDRILTRRAALDPDAILARASARDWGDPAGAARDWRAYAEDMGRLEAVPRFSQKAGIARNRLDGAAIRYPIPLAKAAVAAARAGHVEDARGLIAALNQLQPWQPEKTRSGRGGSEDAAIAAASSAMLTRAKALLPIAETYVLLAQGKNSEAADLLATVANPPADPSTFDLIRRVRAANPERAVLARIDVQELERKLRTQMQTQRKAKLDLISYAENLPRLESQGRKSPYVSQPPYGFRGVRDGWLDRDNKKGGWTVEFQGGAPASTEEMLLLRAAQITREKGGRGFLIVKRDDYEQFYVTTSYGQETSRMPTGHETDADVMFTDAGLSPAPPYAGRKDLVLDADKVWADLSPYYVYEVAAAK